MPDTTPSRDAVREALEWAVDRAECMVDYHRGQAARGLYNAEKERAKAALHRERAAALRSTLDAEPRREDAVREAICECGHPREHHGYSVGRCYGGDSHCACRKFAALSRTSAEPRCDLCNDTGYGFSVEDGRKVSCPRRCWARTRPVDTDAVVDWRDRLGHALYHLISQDGDGEGALYDKCRACGCWLGGTGEPEPEPHAADCPAPNLCRLYEDMRTHPGSTPTAEAVAAFVAAQKPMPPEVARVLEEHGWDLYVRADTHPGSSVPVKDAWPRTGIALHGDHGGLLVRVVAYYEDGDVRSYGHAAIATDGEPRTHYRSKAGPMREGPRPDSTVQEVDDAGRDDARIYPCDTCDTMRTKAEGGTTFTVCEKCWDEHWSKKRPDSTVPTNNTEGGEP